MNYAEIESNLNDIVEGDVSSTPADLEKSSTDWSLFQIRPDLVVFPKNKSDIEKLVQFVNNYNLKNVSKISITPRAAGSGMSGGSLNHSIILDVTRYMNNFVDIKVGDFGEQVHHDGFPFGIFGKATAESGMMYIPFENKTLEQNLIMPAYPASRKLCAIGGMVANNGAGEKSLKYGQNKDFVEELRVILSDGKEHTLSALTYSQLQELFTKETLVSRISKDIFELIERNWSLIQEKRPKTAKNSAGYLVWDVISANSIEDFKRGIGYFDLTKLVVGAQGTTGIISEIVYKLVEAENKQEMLVMFVNDIHQLPKIVSILEKYDLETIELYDDNTFKIGVKFFKEFIKDKGFFKAISYSMRFIPEFFMALSGGVPKFVVLAENVDKSIDAVHNEATSELKDIQKKLPRMKSFIVRGEKAAQKYWDFRHDSFKLLTEHSLKTRQTGSGTRTAPFIDDIAVNPKVLPEYLPKLVKILDEYKSEFLYTIAGHLGNGNFHIIPLVDMNKQENKDKIIIISQRVYDLALQFGGTITAEHNDGIIRTPFLEQMFGTDMIAVFQSIKKIFDPNNIFNPGKKVGMTKEDISKYLA